MLWSVSLDVALEALEHADRVLVGARPDTVGVGVRLLDDPLALRLGRLGQAALVDQEGRLFLGTADDPLGLFLGLLDDALALGVDALGGTHLLGDGHPQLVDEPESGVLVDHHVRRERQLLAVGDQRLEALDEEDDVDVGGPPAGLIIAPAMRHPLALREASGQPATNQEADKKYN